jgi:hypothetical protein
LLTTIQLTAGRGSAKADYLDVSSVRWLNTHYLHERTRSPTDALKVHRLLFSGVAQATNSISSNLKGSGAEDTPLRKREHHLQPKTADGEGDTGVGLIHPEGNVGPVAPPDVITADLEAYTKGILKSREKDWDVMGARRVANLWHGSVAEHGEAGSRSRGILRKRPTRDLLANEEAEDNAGHGARGAFERVTARTGQALKGGFGLVS